MSETIPSKDSTPEDIRDVIGWIAANASGMSLSDWGPRCNTLLKAATEIERLRASLALQVEQEAKNWRRGEDERDRLRAALERYEWLLADGDRCASVVNDAYNDWDGCNLSDWREILDGEMAYQSLKEKRA